MMGKDDWLLRDTKRWWVFTLTILLLGVGWAWQSRVPTSIASAGQIPSPREGFPAPEFTLKTLAGGETVSLSDYRGRVVIVNLWASWCGPCRAEMPALQAVYAAQQAHGLEILAINSTVQDSEAAARAFVQEFSLTFPVLLDQAGEVGQRYRLLSLPSTFFVDRKGVIRSVILGGPMTEAVLLSKIEDLLMEVP